MSVAAPDPKPLGSLGRELPERLSALFRHFRVPGASVAVVADDTSYHYGHGVASLSSNRAVTAETAFNIASCSKAFGAAAVASLVDEGLIDWDDPVAPHVPEFVMPDPWTTREASFRDCCGNRLGLARAGLAEFGFDPEIPAERALSALQYAPFSQPFRDGYTYVNAGHVAAALAAARIVGKTPFELIQERVLTPLGMRHSSGGAAAHNALNDISGWHTIDRSGKAVEIDPIYTDATLPSGEMCISGRDAAQWLRFHLNLGRLDGHEVMSREAVRELHQPVCTHRAGATKPGTGFDPAATFGGYALGWAVEFAHGHHFVQHSGGDFGVHSFTLLAPDAGVGVAVYGNLESSGSRPAAYLVAAALLGIDDRDWARHCNNSPPEPQEPFEPRGDVDSRVIDRAVGRYRHPADGVLEIARAGDTLSGSLLDGYRCHFRLLPDDDGSFVMDFTSPEWIGATLGDRFTVTFPDGAAGGPYPGVTMQFGPVERVFERQPD